MAQWAQIIDGTLVHDGALFTQDVGFQAKAVGVDNYTPYYLYLKDADAFIAPYWVGVIRVLTHTTDYAYVKVQSPFGPQTPPPPNYFIHLTWTDSDQVQQTPGSSIAGSISSPPIITVEQALLQYDSNVITVALVPIAIPIVYVADRKAVLLQSSKWNNPAATIFIGGPLVTADDGNKGGIQLSPGMSYPMDLSETAIPYAITDIAFRSFDSLAGQRLIIAEAR